MEIIMRKIALLFVVSLTLIACTDNQRARNFGGTARIELPVDQKLVNATWKQDDLWYLTRTAKKDEVPETLTFKEDSSFGVLNGEVIFVEK